MYYQNESSWAIPLQIKTNPEFFKLMKMIKAKQSIFCLQNRKFFYKTTDFLLRESRGDKIQKILDHRKQQQQFWVENNCLIHHSTVSHNEIIHPLAGRFFPSSKKKIWSGLILSFHWLRMKSTISLLKSPWTSTVSSWLLLGPEPQENRFEKSLDASVSLIPKLPNPVKKTTHHSLWTNQTTTTTNLMRIARSYKSGIFSPKLWVF